MKKLCESPNRFQHCTCYCLCSSLSFLLIALFVPPAIENFLDQTIRDMTLMTATAASNGSPVWKQFKDSSKKDSAPIWLSVYMWNVTNPADILAGKQPILKEVGPYTYRRNTVRLNISWDTDRDNLKRIRYKDWTYYTFDESQSFPGADPVNDIITNVNLIFQAAFSMDPNLIYPFYDGKTQEHCLFANRTVNWWVFGGLDPDIPPPPLGVPYPGFVQNISFNDTHTYGYSSQYTGEDHLYLAGQVTEWKGDASILCSPSKYTPEIREPAWATEKSNILEGTDGSAWPPLNTIGYGDTVKVWLDILYHIIPLTNINKNTLTIRGVTLNKYQLLPDTLANVSVNPDNAPFWAFAPQGFYNLTRVQGGLPVFASLPHFLYVDEDTQKLVTGPEPSEEKHLSFVGIEPITGMALRAKLQWQVNVHLRPLMVPDWDGKLHPFFSKINPKLFFPVCFLVANGELDDNMAHIFKWQVYLARDSIKVIRLAGTIAGTLCGVFGLIIFLRSRHVTHGYAKGISVTETWISR